MSTENPSLPAPAPYQHHTVPNIKRKKDLKSEIFFILFAEKNSQ
nr:MAG TPA: hypothetical protein [Caudoviricetes sp.]